MGGCSPRHRCRRGRAERRHVEQRGSGAATNGAAQNRVEQWLHRERGEGETAMRRGRAAVVRVEGR